MRRWMMSWMMSFELISVVEGLGKNVCWMMEMRDNVDMYIYS
jgi:hypothetical protein